MTLSYEISLGQLITPILALIGLIGAWFTLRINTQNNAARSDLLEKRVDAHAQALGDLRLHVEATCVKKDDLEKVEERISRRLDTVEHTIRNTSAVILERLAPRPSRQRAGS